ncbi:hypothetical protein [Mycobacterium sp. 852014-50255_SCH5639931]|uniref:hypothetical protein n=1 Tax=Mycobacterium sp. 852014-50255_SCH5639931 TaxID=1834112 RepID=UPI000AD7EDDD|nr:hypothetical protein [Mycobacterium sp. 852014-50255_SCH5639931]
MTISARSLRAAAVGAAGASAVAGALLFGASPAAQAAPVSGPDTSFTTTGPHGTPGGPGIIPDRPGGGHGGHGWGGHGWGGGGHPGWGSGNRGFWAPGHWWNWWW